MTDNPFTAPNNPSDVVPPSIPHSEKTKQAPGGLTAVCVICLALGFLGFSGSCLGGAVMAFQSSLLEFAMDNTPEGPQKEVQKISLAANQGILVPSLILSAINLFVGLMLFVGSIGCLAKKEKYRNILRVGILAAMFYSVLKIAVTIYSGIVTPTALRAEVEKRINDPGYQEIKGSVDWSVWLTIGGAVFGVIFGLCLIGFYFWAKGYLNRDEIVQHFN